MIKRNGINSRKKALALAVSCALLTSQATYAQEINPEVDEELGFMLEELVVFGVRASQSKAIDIKRESGNIVDAIVAEDIGKLPDITITDSLQRITGVQITREANEGTSLNVRGMPQVLTTLNGEQFLSPWTITDVGANYGDIPAGMISGADVYKSASSSLVAGGISGLVDLKTFTPFELEEGLTGKLRVAGSQGSEAGETDHNISLFGGYNHKGVYGVTFGLFSNTSNAANYRMTSDQRLAFLDGSDINRRPTDALNLDGDASVESWYIVPQSYGAGSNFMERERTGASATFQAMLTDNVTVRGDVFYTRMDQYDRGVTANFNGQTNVNAYDNNGCLPNLNEPKTEDDPACAHVADNGRDGYEHADLYNNLLEGSQVGYGSRVDAEGITLRTLRVANIEAVDFQTVSTNEINETASVNVNLQMDYTNQDNFGFSVRYIHGDAEKQYRKAQMHQGKPAWVYEAGTIGKKAIDPYYVTVDYRSSIPSFSFPNDISDPNDAEYVNNVSQRIKSTDNLHLYSADGEGSGTTADLDVLRGDLSYEFGGGSFVESLDFGLRFSSRGADHSKFYYVTPTARYSTWNDTSLPASQRYQLREGFDIWQKYPEWLSFNYADNDSGLIDPDVGGLQWNGFSEEDPRVITFNDFGGIGGFEGGVSAIDPQAWDSPLAFLDSLYADKDPNDPTKLLAGGKRVSTAADPGYTYDVDEDSISSYLQVNFSSDAGIPFHGDFGIKVIQTDRTVVRMDIPLPEDLDSSNSIGYDYWQKVALTDKTQTEEYSFTEVLPSFNINFYPHDDVITRFSASKTMSRNTLDFVGSGLTLWYQRCKEFAPGTNNIQQGPDGEDLEVTCVGGGDNLGHPDAKPWLANVFNITTEWYFNEDSLLSAGVFLIDVTSSVERSQELESFDVLDRPDLDQTTANIYTTKNTDGSDLLGFELGYKQPLRFLPGDFFQNLGVELNFTYSDSDTSENDVEGEAFPLESNSKLQSNFILWYDKDKINARLAYNWRSKEYLGRVALNTSATTLDLGNWLEPTGYLDLSFNYKIAEFIDLSLNGTNMTNQHRVSYSQYSEQFNSLWMQERRYSIGVTWTL